MFSENTFARGCASALLFIFLFVASASAQTTAFTYQGKLSDGSNPSPTGSYEMRFRLYDTPTPNTGTQSGGDQIFSAATSNAVSVAGGVFAVNLDFGANPFATGATLYLEIGVR